MNYGMYWSKPLSVKRNVVDDFIKELGQDPVDVAYVEIHPTIVYVHKYQYNADGSIRVGPIEPYTTEHCYSIVRGKE